MMEGGRKGGREGGRTAQRIVEENTLSPSVSPMFAMDVIASFAGQVLPVKWILAAVIYWLVGLRVSVE